ncbi:GNAT family N-acetyltransferase [Dokdonia sp.]|uniref:GNAT family N-acetyltransferase n=1 Tax=Dokdonia sp. TaxID=2024995 RepID=UPI003263332E
MVTISDQLQLIPITLEDQSDLFKLMQRIYPPAYAHFWHDQGNWYINHVYGSESLKKDLSEIGSHYYFVRFRESVFNQDYKIIGIFKTIENCTYPEQPDISSFKIQRIYLDTTIQGKGIGKQLMQYAHDRAQATNHKLIWLDAMDQHPQAMHFYDRLGYQKGGLQCLDFELLHLPYRPMWYLYKHL